MHMEEKEINGLREAAHTPFQRPLTMIPLPPSLPTFPSQPIIDPPRSIAPSPRIQPQHGGLFWQVGIFGFLPALESDWPESAIERMDYRCLATIKGGAGCQFSSLIVMGDYLYAGASSSDGSSHSIRIWQKTGLQECGGFGSKYGAVKALVVAGDRILSAHQDLKIRVWSRGRQNRHRPKQVADDDDDVRMKDLPQEMEHMTIGDSFHNSHELLASMPTVKDYIKSFIPPKNYVQVRRHYKRLWIEHVDNISGLAIGGTAADPVLYSASWDRTIKVWKLSDFKCVESFKAHDDAINALLVAPDGLLYSASADAKVKVWGTSAATPAGAGQKHSLFASLNAHKSAVNALALSQDSERRHATILYSAGCDRGIVVWEREESGQQLMVAKGVLRGHRHAILSLVSKGSMLCSGSADRTIRVWQRTSNSGRAKEGSLLHACVAVLQAHSGAVNCLTLAFDTSGNRLLYSSGLDHEIKLWQLSGCADKGKYEERAYAEQKPLDHGCQQICRSHSV